MSAKERLLITLSFLAEGKRYIRLRWELGMAHNTISLIVRDTCKAIIDTFGPLYLKNPKSQEELLYLTIY